MKIRIQKHLSEQGICSRRTAESWIEKGYVFLNGKKVTEQGLKIDPKTDKVTLSNLAHNDTRSYQYLLVHKPKGILTNCAKPGEKEIKNILPKKFHSLSSIGRLDKDSEGLILFTNDGIFAKKCLDPKNAHTRVYKVWLNAALSSEKKTKLESGITISSTKFAPFKTKPAKIDMISPTHLSISITEGKNRQIRRMFQAVGLEVIRLKRMEFGPYKLGKLPIGKYKEIPPPRRD